MRDDGLGGIWCRFLAAENFGANPASRAPYTVTIKDVLDARLYEADAWAREHAGVFGETWFRETSPMFTFKLNTDEFFYTSTFGFDNAYVAFEFKIRFG